MDTNKVITAAAAVVAAGALIGTGAALSNAATGTPTPSPTTSSAPSGAGPAMPGHTPVTGAELAKVTAAVTAKDSTVIVTTVQKDPDGSYDVDATKAGTHARFDVSADLKTITTNPGGGPGRGGAATPHTTTSATDTSIAT